MAKFFLTNKAVDDLSKIWNYTYETWSEKQADKYLDLIFDCQELANTQSLGASYLEISIVIFGFKSGKYIIFYRKLNVEGIEIIRILHFSMDLNNRIQD